MSDATWVGVALDYLPLDEDSDCLTGADVNVWTAPSRFGEELVLSNTAQGPQCAKVTLQFLLPKPTVPDQDLICVAVNCLVEMAAFRVGEVLHNVDFQVRAAQGLLNGAPNQAEGALAQLTNGSLIDKLAGEVAAQYDSLMGLWRASFSVSLTNLDVQLSMVVGGNPVDVRSPLTVDPSNALGCLQDGCPLIEVNSNPSGERTQQPDGNRDPNISTARFQYFGGITPEYRNKGGRHGVYGAVIYNWYNTDKKVRHDLDFWATSTDSSVTPQSKSRLTRNYSGWYSNSDGVRMIQAAPLSVDKQGAGETITIGVNLAGQVSAKKDGTGGDIGAQFSVARSYTKPDQNSGGASLGANGHYALWETADNGSGFGKLATGVATWSIPTGAPIGWIYEAEARYCNDPCGW